MVSVSSTGFQKDVVHTLLCAETTNKQPTKTNKGSFRKIPVRQLSKSCCWVEFRSIVLPIAIRLFCNCGGHYPSIGKLTWLSYQNTWNWLCGCPQHFSNSHPMYHLLLMSANLLWSSVLFSKSCMWPTVRLPLPETHRDHTTPRPSAALPCLSVSQPSVI